MIDRLFHRIASPLLFVTVLLTARAAVAAEPPAATPNPPPRHALYLELLGKAGLWGLGYDYQVTTRIGVGGVASYSLLHGQHLAGLSPYLAIYPFGRAEAIERSRHRGFLHLGPELFITRTPSPGPEWPGRTSAGVGGELSAGYEYRGPLLVRAYLMGTVGQNGFAPWAGVSVGWLR